MGKDQNDLLFDAPSFYSQPISASISFQIIPLPSLLGRGWGWGFVGFCGASSYTLSFGMTNQSSR